jgi:hypothetical protein
VLGLMHLEMLDVYLDIDLDDFLVLCLMLVDQMLVDQMLVHFLMHLHIPPPQVAVVKWVDEPCLLPPPPARACVVAHVRGRGLTCVKLEEMRSPANCGRDGQLGFAASLPQFVRQGWACIPCARSTALRPLAGCAGDWRPAVLHPVAHARAASAGCSSRLCE